MANSRGTVVWTNDDGKKPFTNQKPSKRGAVNWTKNDGIKTAPKATSARGKVAWVENDGLKPAPWLRPSLPYYTTQYYPDARLVPHMVVGSLWVCLVNIMFSPTKTSLDTFSLERSYDQTLPVPGTTVNKSITVAPRGTAFIYAGEKHVVELYQDREVTVVRPTFLWQHGQCVASNINFFAPIEIASDENAIVDIVKNAQMNVVDLLFKRNVLKRP